ncbi:MAG: hypothetical protein F6K41_07850 [Symploca sp. SIO3E6]|nr:hypothetical protein [Caldora sp. SIO3E6]
MAKRNRIILSLLLGISIAYCPQAGILAQESVPTTETVQSSKSNKPRGDIRLKYILSDLQKNHQQIEKDINEISDNIDTYKKDIQQTNWSAKIDESYAEYLLNTIDKNLNQLDKNKQNITQSIEAIKESKNEISFSVENIKSNSKTTVLDSKNKIVEIYQKASEIYKLVAEQKQLDANDSPNKTPWFIFIGFGIIFTFAAFAPVYLLVIRSMNESNDEVKIAPVVIFAGNIIKLSCKLLPSECFPEIVLYLQHQEKNTPNNFQLLQERISYLLIISFQIIQKKLLEDLIYPSSNKFKK